MSNSQPGGAVNSSEGPLAEFTSLRAEILLRQGFQASLFTFQLTSAAGLFSFALSDASHTPLLLVLPFTSYLLGWRYVLHYLATQNMGAYIADHLSNKVGGGLHWEQWISNEPSRVQRRFFVHPVRMAFPGVAVAAIVWVAVYLAKSIGSTISWTTGVTLLVFLAVDLMITIESVRAVYIASSKWSNR
jgi:hypothetical protein